MCGLSGQFTDWLTSIMLLSLIFPSIFTVMKFHQLGNGLDIYPCQKVKKKVRNLEGLISIRGELVTEAANYNPLEVPCRSLQPDSLKLPPKLTSDLLIVISAPRHSNLSIYLFPTSSNLLNHIFTIIIYGDYIQ